MSTGYSWEGIRHARAMLLGARHVPERLCGDYVYLGRYIKCSTFTFFGPGLTQPSILSGSVNEYRLATVYIRAEYLVESCC